MVQGGQGSHAGVHGGERIADADADARGRAVGLADDVAQAAHGLANAAVAGALRIGSGLPVARDAHQDQARIERGELLPAAAPFLQGAGAEVLDDYIRFT